MLDFSTNGEITVTSSGPEQARFFGAIFVDSWFQVSLIREIQKLYHVTNLF